MLILLSMATVRQPFPSTISRGNFITSRIVILIKQIKGKSDEAKPFGLTNVQDLLASAKEKSDFTPLYAYSMT